MIDFIFKNPIKCSVCGKPETDPSYKKDGDILLYWIKCTDNFEKETRTLINPHTGINERIMDVCGPECARELKKG